MTTREAEGLQHRLPRLAGDFRPTAAAARAGHWLPPLVVLRAARGFGKTSTVVSWLQGPHGPHRLYVWLQLTAPTSPAQVWRGIYTRLVDLGLPTAHATVPTAGPNATHGSASGDDGDWLAAVREVLVRLRRRLVVVVDDSHHLGRTRQEITAIDDEIVSLLQRYSLLHVVVAGRESRPIEVLGPAAVDAVMLRRRDLALSAVEVEQLAETHGISLPPGGAELLSEQLLGWPAILRGTVLRYGAHDDALEDVATEVATEYAAALFQEPEVRALLPVMAALALAGRIRPDDLAALVEAGGHGKLLPALLRTEFVTPDAAGHYALPRVASEAIRRLVARQEPELWRDLHARLATLRRERGEAAAALEHAVAAEAWEPAVEIAQENWAQLLAAGAGSLIELLETLPQELFPRLPAFLAARDVILQRHTAERAEQAIRTDALRPGQPLRTVPPSLTQRLAQQFSGDGGPDAATTEPEHLPEDVRRALPGALLQWGTVLLYRVEAPAAAFVFALAAERARNLGDAAAERDASSLVAVALAVMGHVRTSREWLTHARSSPTTASLFAQVAECTAAELLALLVLDDAPPACVPELPPAHPATALRDLVLIAQRHRSVLMGHENSVRGLVPAGPLLAAGAAAIVAADAQLTSDGPAVGEEPIVPVPAGVTHRLSIRLAFYSGGFERVAELCEGVERGLAALWPATAIELELLRACAAHRMGDRPRAVDGLSTAVTIAEETGVIQPFLLVPRADLHGIAAGSDDLVTFLDGAGVMAWPALFPEPLRVADLSDAHRRVLRMLAEPLSLAQIGRELFISESTIKSHVQRIYRKLRVTQRDDAVQRARSLGLLE